MALHVSVSDKTVRHAFVLPQYLVAIVSTRLSFFCFRPVPEVVNFEMDEHLWEKPCFLFPGCGFVHFHFGHETYTVNSPSVAVCEFAGVSF